MKLRLLKFVPILASAGLAGWLIAQTYEQNGFAANATRKAAPAWELKEVTGKVVRSSDFKGKVGLLDFWATWCPPCRAELPSVIKTYEKHHPKGFEIIGISLDKEEAKLTSFTKEKEMTWQQYFDGKGWGNNLAAKYGVQSIPATYLLDGEGQIIAKDLRGEEMDGAVAKALAQN